MTSRQSSEQKRRPKVFFYIKLRVWKLFFPLIPLTSGSQSSMHPISGCLHAVYNQPIKFSHKENQKSNDECNRFFLRKKIKRTTPVTAEDQLIRRRICPKQHIPVRHTAVRMSKTAARGRRLHFPAASSTPSTIPDRDSGRVRRRIDLTADLTVIRTRMIPEAFQAISQGCPSIGLYMGNPGGRSIRGRLPGKR